MPVSTFLLDNWLRLALGLASIYITLFIVKFVRHRRFYANLPSPNHSMLWGNLKVMGEEMKNYPSDIHPQTHFTEMAIKYSMPPAYYMDLWPFAESLVIITDPALAAQTQNSPNFHRHPFVNSFLGGLVGKRSIFSTTPKDWHRQRGWFAPAFSMTHLLTLVPGMVEEALVFKEKLTKYACTGEIFVLNEATTQLAIDVIGRTVGDIQLNSQTQYSLIKAAFEGAVAWTTPNNAPIWQKIVGPWVMLWYTTKLDGLLGEVIKERYRRREGKVTDKSILDLALKGYLKEKGDAKVRRIDLDKDFMQIALDNAKTFLTGGHDTTASLITYMYHYLNLYPDVLARVRAEHTQIFGPTLESTIQTLHTQPALLNSLTLTHATIKETLRLNPPGTTIRQSTPDAILTDSSGRTYPTANHMICMIQSAFHRNAATFPNPTLFNPDRFLDPAVNASTAWQPFERGPRNCIGQQLSLLETKVIMVLTARWFAFEAVFKDGTKSVEGWGGRAYQQLTLSAKPKDGLPVRVRLVGEKEGEKL